MKLQFLFLAIFLIAQGESLREFLFGTHKNGNLIPPPPPRRDLVPRDLNPLYYEQKLDHFNPANKTTWKQKYYFNDEVYNGDQDVKVAFLMLGGEGPQGPSWLQFGPMYDYAAETEAILFTLEHRYYGDSRPTDDLSVKNLQFLSSEQALADAAAFIQFANEEYGLGNNTRWIAFGGSYSGSLAAWLRMKYPHLVHGAVSNSGPLLAKVDFQDYFRVVGESLGTSSAECVSAVKSAFDSVGSAISDADTDALKNVNSVLHLCEPLENYLDDTNTLASLQSSLSDMFAGVVQYNNIIAGSTNIDDVCAIMTDESIGDPLARLGALVETNLIDSDDCFGYNYQEFVDELKGATDYDSEAAVTFRQWLYQTCTEFGFYQTSSYETHVFGDGFKIDYFINTCIDIYGDQFDGDFIDFSIDHTNIIYGGLDIEASNVVYVHGSIDPWHALGILETKDQDAPAIYINGTAHCANMYAPKASDPPGLSDAIDQIGDLIKEWLAQ